MTTNPNRSEITLVLLPHQIVIDRLDRFVGSTIFELKGKALMEEINTNKVFGDKVAHDRI